MKKLILIIMLIFLVATVTYGCSNLHNTSSSIAETQTSSALEAPTEPVIAEIDGLSFQAKQKNYQADVLKIVTVFSNGTKDSYSYGAQYQLQAYQNSRWIHVPLAIDTTWTSEETIASAGAAGDIVFPVADENSSLSPGRYRIVLPITNNTSKEDFNIAAEFTIT